MVSSGAHAGDPERLAARPALLASWSRCVKPTATGSPVVPEVTCTRTRRSRGAHRCATERRVAALALAQLVLCREGQVRRSAALRTRSRTPLKPLAVEVARRLEVGELVLERAHSRGGRSPAAALSSVACDGAAVGLDRHPEVRLRRVLLLRVRDRRGGRREQHHGRDQARHLGRVVQRAARDRGVLAAGVLDRLAREADQPLVERDRRDRPAGAALDLAAELLGGLLARVAGLLEHRRERRPRRGGAGRAASRCGPRPPSPRRGRSSAPPTVQTPSWRDADLADLERGAARRPGSVSRRMRHRRRARVRGLRP